MTRMMLKSYQMIGLGQRIFVMTTASFAHLMKKESKTAKLMKKLLVEVKGAL